jgi:hypothetical protein
MNAHRVDVLDGADDDAIVDAIADDLHLELFPAEHGFLDQHLGSRRCVQAALDDLQEFFPVVGDAAAVPPSVKDGRMMAAGPRLQPASASSSACATVERGVARPIRAMAS